MAGLISAGQLTISLADHSINNLLT